MADEASHQLARQVVAKLCQPLGWQGIQNGACDVLADLLKRYVITLGRTTAAYVANGNRTDATLDDVAFAFEDLGISMDDLLVYSRLVDSAPLPSLPHFPIPRHSAHIYSPLSAPPTTSKPRPLVSEEDEEGEEEKDDIIPPYFPPLPSKKMEDEEDDAESGVHEPVGREGSAEPSEPLPTPGDPLSGLPQMFRCRSRLSSEISEEGGEGGSRRSSFSDSSGLVLNRVVSEPAAGIAAGSGVAGQASSSHSGNRNPAEISNSATESSRQISPNDSTNLVANNKEVSLTNVVRPSTEISGESFTRGREVSDPRGSDPDSASERKPTEVVSSSSSRPPPLRLMSGGGNLDSSSIISPLLPSPLVGGVRPTLPLLSPLSATPTPPNPPAKLPSIATPTGTLPSPPQLVPTTAQTKSLESTQPNETSSATNIEMETRETESETKTSTLSVSFVHSLKEASSVESTSMSPENKVKPPSVEKPQSSTATEKTDEQTSESFSPPPPKVKSPEAEGEEGESVSDEESEETQSNITVETRVTESSLYPPPSTLPLTATPAISSPQSLPIREKSAVQSGEEEDDYDNESVISSASSKASLEEPEKLDRETGFSLNQSSMREEERAALSAEQVQRRSREVADINTEGAGEGGVACILDNDEEEMDIPDIDEQLELSESDDSTSSGTSSGSEAEPGRKVPEVEEGVRVKEEEEVRVFLEPPKAGVRSSSHSLASTPSVSPSPSPIPGSTSHHSIPVSVSDPLPPPTDPYLKPSPVSSVRKDVAKSTQQVPLSQRREATGPFVVTIKTDLVPSLRERGRRGREGGGGRNKKQRKEPSSRFASLQKDSEKRQKKRFPPSQRSLQPPPVASARIKSEPRAPHSHLIVCIKRSLLRQGSPVVTTSDLLPQPEYDEEEEEEEDDDDVIVTHSSAERVKFKPPATERVKTETPSRKGWYQGQGSQYSAPEGPTPGQGVWRRELDISEMGLVAPPPPILPQETQHVRVIPQPSSSSSSGDSDSESESSSPSPLSHPPAPSPAPSPWQRPIRSEDEESTSSGATVASGGLKLKLKISKAFLQSVPIFGKQSPGKPDKKHRKKGAASTDSMATTSRGGREGQSRKRGRSNKNPQKAGKKGGSNIPQIKLPKLELSAQPGATSSSSWQQTTPRSGRAGLYPPLKLPAVAVSPGGEVWYCPQCSKPDDGSPMIGCDGSCEGWYHWYCVGITQAPPENERWFCPSCAQKKKKKSRKRRN